MKILYVLPYCPVPPTFGGALRVYHLLRQMTRVHQVSVIVYGVKSDEDILRNAYPSLERITIVPPPHSWKGIRKRLSQLLSIISLRSGAYYYFYSKEMQHAIDSALAKNDFDLIQTEAHIMGWFVLRSGAFKILDTQNVEYDTFRRMSATTSSPLRKIFYWLEATKCRREEIAICSKQDAMFVTSVRDKSILDADIPDIPKFIIPNGVDTSYFHSRSKSEDPLALVFTGSMNYPPNSDGAIFFIDKILPRIRSQFPGIRLYVVGNAPPRALRRRNSASVVITGYVEDVRPYIERASVYVVPLLSGGGTRLKVLEALAMRKGIVTTTIGCEGIDLNHHESLMIANDPEEFADAVIHLLRNTPLRQRLANAGNKLVRLRYDWDVIGETLNSVYASLLSGVNTRRARM